MTDDAGEIAVLFCDICEFDDVIKECQESVVEIMDEVFRTFDNMCKLHGVQKIEVPRADQTVGKTYMAAGGLKFIENKPKNEELIRRHFTLRVVDLARDMIEFSKKYTYRAGKHLKAKIGIHYGSCIFGVLGYHKPQFSLIGDTINTTSRVCTTGNAGNIILSREAYEKLKEAESAIIRLSIERKLPFEKMIFEVNAAHSESTGLHERKRHGRHFHPHQGKDQNQVQKVRGQTAARFEAAAGQREDDREAETDSRRPAADHPERPGRVSGFRN